MKKVYFCHTAYHLLITLCKATVDDDCVIVLFDKISNRCELKNKILDLKMAKEVFLFSESETNFDKLNLQNRQENYVYNDWTHVGAYLRKNKIYYHLIEDGYNYFEYRVFERSTSFFNFLRKIIFRRNKMALGYSKYVKSIEVNSLKYLKKDFRYKKYKEVPRKELFSQLSEYQKTVLSKIFDIKATTEKIEGVLILTQPLYQDKWVDYINSEIEQLQFYQTLVNQHLDKKVFIKPHPRDNTDYSLIHNAFLLQKNVPIEMYEILTNCHFSIGITHSSTALDYLNCVDQKIVLHNLKENL